MAKLDQTSAPSEHSSEPIKLPTEVEVYINSDGSVTFADLAAELMPIASTLNPDQPLVCAVPHSDTGQLSQ